MSDNVPEIRVPGVPPGTPKAERAYLEIPVDETPNPSLPGAPLKEFNPQLLPKISVVFDPRPLMEAVNEAVIANDIDRVVKVFSEGKIRAVKESATLVRAQLIP